MAFPKFLVVTGLAATTGCGELPSGASTLTDEQREIVEYVADVADRSTPLVIEVVRSMDGGWVDRNGAVNDPELMVAEIESTRDDIRFYVDNDRFFAGPTSAMIGGDSNIVGYHSPQDLTPSKRIDNYVVLNSDIPEAWNSVLVEHEVMHFKAFHDSDVQNDLLAIEDLNYGNIEVPRTIRAHADLPYMGSGLFYGPSSLIVSLDQERADALAEAKASREHGDGRGALTLLKELLTIGYKDEWCAEQASIMHSRTIFSDEFGVDESILATNIADSGMYETEVKVRNENISEFMKAGREHTNETMQQTKFK